MALRAVGVSRRPEVSREARGPGGGKAAGRRFRLVGGQHCLPNREAGQPSPAHTHDLTEWGTEVRV